jgi:hypothetical protein
MPEWADVVQGMIERFGQDPSTVTILLRFLKALVEEVQNARLTVVEVSTLLCCGGDTARSTCDLAARMQESS